MTQAARWYTLGFHSVAEFNTFLTFVLLGMSIMMVVSAITSAPGFITKYYEYATGVPDAVCEKPYFWNNANTFYNVGTYVMQLICEPLALTRFARRIPLQIRLYVGLIIMFLEMLLLLLIPVITIPTQDGAIAVLMVVSVTGGFSKALVDSTTNALVGPFPTKFMNGEQWGLTVVALFMSVIQIILKASMGVGFTSGLNQSRIYLAIGMFVQLVALFELAIMPRNPYAQRFTAEYRIKAQQARNAAGASEAATSGKGATGEAGVAASGPVPVLSAGELTLRRSSASTADDTPMREAIALSDGYSPRDGGDEEVTGIDANGVLIENRSSSEKRRSSAISGTAEGDVQLDDTDVAIKHDPLEVADEVRAVPKRVTDGAGDEAGRSGFLTARGDADGMEDVDQKGNLSSTQQMLRASVGQVIRQVWPMLLSAFIVFFTSMLIFPGVFFKVSDDEWYPTIVVLLFNVGDFVSRILLMIRVLRPPPKVVMIGTGCRLTIIPLLVLCARGYIPGVALPYVLITLLGLTNGFFGTMALIHCPRTPTLTTAGERSVAAIWAGIFLMCGLCFGSNLALAITGVIDAL